MIGAGPRPPPPAGRSQADIVLSARAVSKRYRPRSARGQTVVANDSLDLTVHRGEIVALLGPNGAGKSTFLRQVAGQLLPSSGKITVGGVDMVARPELAKRHLSVIPQECEPLSNLTAEEQVRYFSRIKSSNTRLSDERVEGILTTVGLLGQRKKLVRELSGGYKRRVLIAVALAGDSPDLLLLDEPTTGLDPEARRSVWNVIELLKTEGRGVLLTTHYIEEAEVLADQIVIINDGRFVARGSVEEILHRVGSRGRMDIRNPDRLGPDGHEAIQALERKWKVVLRRENHIRFEVADPFSPATVSELERLAQLGISASLSPSSLEDAYLQIVGKEIGNGA
jgi:ABC-2 type transport system ATP-binding protein